MTRYRRVQKTLRTSRARTFLIAVLAIAALLVLPGILTGDNPAARDDGKGDAPQSHFVPPPSASEAAGHSTVDPAAQEIPLGRDRVRGPVRPAPPSYSTGATPIEDPAAWRSDVPFAPEFDIPLAPPLQRSFRGISDTGNYPPDPILAVGPNHVVVVVNRDARMHVRRNIAGDRGPGIAAITRPPLHAGGNKQ